MHDIGLPSRLALACPYPCERDAVPVQPFVQTLAKFREERPVRIITDIREAPVDGEMRHQGEADRFRKPDRLHDVGGLTHGDVLARAKLPVWLCPVRPERLTARSYLSACFSLPNAFFNDDTALRRRVGDVRRVREHLVRPHLRIAHDAHN